MDRNEDYQDVGELAPHSAEMLKEKAALYSKETKSLVERIRQQIAETTYQIPQMMESIVQDYINPPLLHGWYTARKAMDTYPILRYFSFLFLLFSFIPLALFALFTVTTTIGAFIVGMASVTVVESIILFPAAVILGFALVAALGVTATVSLGYFATWVGVASLKVLTTKLNMLFGGASATMQKNLDAFEHGISQGLEDSGMQ